VKSRAFLITLACLLAVTAAPFARQGRGGPGAGPMQGPPGMGRERQIVGQFDKDKNGRLDATERQAARAYLASQPTMGPGPRGFGPGGMGGGAVEPGPKLAPAGVKSYASEPLYDPSTLRTLFLQFENADWEAELMAFNNTDVDVPATLVVDGKTYRDVGAHFRGASSYFGVPAGRKHSINLSMDFAHQNQQLLGYSTLNLLNSHEDPTYLRSVLYLEAARTYIPAPKANYARVVINGESWGVYVSAQQFNKEFINEWFKTTDGARWKTPGSPGGRAGLEYLGEDAAAYRNSYEIKSKDDPKSWAALIGLTRVLNQTPPDQLEKALAPILDVDGALKFLALEATLVNNDGYWVRASDYSIYLDPKGRFHLFPHDANETFPVGRGGPPRGGPPPPPGQPGQPGDFRGGQPPQGRPVGPGGPGRMMMGGGAELDPLVGLNDNAKALRSKLLAVPALRAKYLAYVHEIAERWLNWDRMGPIAAKYQALIAADVKTDTHKLDSFEAFENDIAALKAFMDKRRAFIAAYKPPQ
jgi:hypothetical protein